MLVDCIRKRWKEELSLRSGIDTEVFLNLGKGETGMDALQIQYEHWMNHHADKPETRQAWMLFERVLNDALSQEIRTLLEPSFKTYLCELERQAYRSGFAAGVRLVSLCYGPGE